MSSDHGRIVREARPGESWAEVEARVSGKCIQDQARPGESWQEFKARRREIYKSKKPEEVELVDCFVSADSVAIKDGRHFMDVALFRMSKREKRAGEIIRYNLVDGYVEVKAGPDGMATIWDYDIVLMLLSHLTESMNRFKNGRGAMPGRIFTMHVSDVLRFSKRGDGGSQSERVESALDRLKGTIIKSVFSRAVGKEKLLMREVKSEGLISGYRVLSVTGSGRVDRVEVELSNWIYLQVTRSPRSAVLTLSSEYFLIESAVGRFVYRLARRAAGNDRARWGFKTIYERSGVTRFKEFCRTLRRLIRLNNLPEYELREEAGQSGPQLIMTRRGWDSGCG
ncbi:replication initiator protein A [Pseudomonas argentinensis]|uniref:replication initiator protein A n=1 Tax=Phytopseudomonas argentinensis TaxID=289370 RepID=UPI0009F1EA6D|nr:replication initiator protein A [Pseudomonas argentinensis]